MSTTRRSLLKSTAWSVPVILTSCSAPAYTTSTPQPEPDCDPETCAVTATRIKVPGRNAWSYAIEISCDIKIRSVRHGGTAARRSRNNLWILELPGNRALLTLQIETVAGPITRTVRVR